MASIHQSKQHHNRSDIIVTTHNVTDPRRCGNNYSSAASHGLCLSKECVKVAAAILSDLDTTVNPCDDFYLYSCGGWIKSNPIPDGQSDWSMFKKLTEANELVIKNALETKLTNHSTHPVEMSAKEKAKTYYYSCIDKKGSIEKLVGRPLLDLMEEKLGNWQLLQHNPSSGEAGAETDVDLDEEVITNRTIFQNR